MLRALVRLAVRLPAVAEGRQQSAHAVGADLVAHLCKATASLSWLFDTHKSGRTGHPSLAGLDATPPILDERPVLAGQMSPAAALTSHPAFRQGRGVEILQSTVDRAAREPGDLRDHLQAAPSCRANLSGCEHPPPPLSSLEPTAFQRWRIACVSIMPTRILPERTPRNPVTPSQFTTWCPNAYRFTCCGGCP